MEKAFYNKKGQLTHYGLSCGYVERQETFTPENIRTTLWKESCAYHVRTHNFDTHTRLAWEVVNTLTEARKIYAQHIRQYHKGK
jgi:hypothetical protein